MFFFQHPAERALVVSEQLFDAAVVHLLVVQLLAEELVLLTNLVFRAHERGYGPCRDSVVADIGVHEERE